MCGIAGVRRFDGEPVSRELLANMAARLLHRGPDATGNLDAVSKVME
jgi:asparagine synthase (glutamine-hydrolysing)